MAMKVHISINHGLVALLLVMICLSFIMAKVQAMTEQLEEQQYHQRLNKPVVKSIKSPDGDIIDCVHISHQPAFDHPSLKNHTIQMRPSFHPLGLHDENKVASEMDTSSVPQLWHQNGRCPEGTIPIRRTKKDDVLRASSVEGCGKKRNRTIPCPAYAEHDWKTSTHERAIVFAKGGRYHGGKATLNVWNPYVQDQSEYSVTELWILGGPEEQFSTLEAGWHVFPRLYGDTKTRVFIRWTQDGYKKTGCYNLLCSGFVQVNKEMALGSSINPISSYGGQQFQITLLIWKDPTSGNWWLRYEQLAPLGYWPSSLFPGLSNGASQIQCGGEVLNNNSNGKHTSTQMGSGHFPEELLGKASFVKNVQIVDDSDNLQYPQDISTSATRPDYYNVMAEVDHHFFYGGPGRKLVRS